jgi:hypothetical protein
MAKEALVVFSIPKKHIVILPGHGWRPRDDYAIKIKTDACISFKAQKGGARGIARSSSATFLGAWSKPLYGISDPLIAEALALHESVIFASLRGFQRVVFETDCLEVVDLWKSRHDSRSVVAPILQDIGEFALNFSSFVIQHVSRSATHSAHLCAKLACTMDGTHSWLECISDCLLVSILADRSGAFYSSVKLSVSPQKRRFVRLSLVFLTRIYKSHSNLLHVVARQEILDLKITLMTSPP